MSSRRWLAWALAAVAAVLLAGRVVAAVYVDYRWYEAMGATALWRAQAANTLLLRGLAAAGGTLFLFVNLYAVRQSVVSVILPRRVANLEIGEEVPSRFLMGAVLALSLVLGALLTLPSESWTTLALARYGESFGESDPYFQSDLGFFMYWLPLERALYVWSLIALLLAVAVVVFLYGLTSSLRWDRGTLHVSTYVRRHLTALGVVLLLVLAWSYRLDAYDVLLEGSGTAGAVTYVDRSVTIPVNLGLQLVTFGSALVVFWAGWTGQLRVAFGTVSAILLLSLALRQVLPSIVERVADVPDPAARERPYQDTRAAYTRRAYDVGRVGLLDPGAAFPTASAAAAGTPIWDATPLRRAVDRARSAPTVASDVGWRALPDGILAHVVARPPRAEAEEWAALEVRASVASPRGGVRLASMNGELAEGTPLPAVLVADSAGGPVLVADSADRVLAPELGSWGSRLAHAWSLQNFRLLFGELPRPNPRIVRRRDVRERVGALAPFFGQGGTVAPAIVGDSLYWLLHLYSASDAYPLSRRVSFDGAAVRYLYHAATAVVNAHSGRVTLVLDPVPDPVARTWAARFPGLFTPWAGLPAGLAAAVPPAVEGARAQAEAVGMYGTSAGTVGARLHVATTDGADSLVAADAPTLLALDTTLAWVAPLVDERDYLRGLVVATGGLQPATHWHPLPGANTVRWPTLVNRLRRGPPTAGGAERDERVVHGRVRALPLADGALYAQPHYAWRADAAPTVARVVVATGDSVVAGQTIGAALGVEPPAAAVAAPTTVEELRAAVSAAYDAMRAALARGDWRAFGEAYDALGDIVGTPPR